MSVEDYIKQLHDYTLFGRYNWKFDESAFTLDLGAVCFYVALDSLDTPYLTVQYVSALSQADSAGKQLVGYTCTKYTAMDTLGVDPLYALLWSLRPLTVSPDIGIKEPFNGVAAAFDYAFKHASPESPKESTDHA